MKKLLLAFLLLGAALCCSAQSVFTNGQLTSAGATCPIGSGATNCVVLPLTSQTSSVVVQINGTFVATIAIEVSPDGGTTWITAQGPVTAPTVGGTWLFSAESMTYLRVRASAYTSGTVNVNLNPSNATQAAAAPDPCLSPAVQKKSSFVDITAATTTSLTNISGTTITYVCGFAVTMSGTTAAETIQFISGTGATCGTSTVTLSPVFNSGILTSGATVISYGGHGSIFSSTIQSTKICAITTVGTSPEIDVLISYVQQ